MGDIQESAKHVVGPMIAGKPILLDTQMQTAIASWATSAAITIECDRRTDNAIPEVDRRWFYEQHIPPDSFKAWIGRYPKNNLNGFIWKHAWSVHLDKDIINSEDPIFVPTNTQTTTYILGQLYVHVFSFPTVVPFDVMDLGRRGDVVLKPHSQHNHESRLIMTSGHLRNYTTLTDATGSLTA